MKIMIQKEKNSNDPYKNDFGRGKEGGGGTLKPKRIKKIKDQTDQFFEYHKRIIALRRYIEKYPENKIQHAKEIMECQEEQKKIIERSRQSEFEKEKEKKRC